MSIAVGSPDVLLPPPIPVPDSARRIHEQIVSVLGNLLRKSTVHCLDPFFTTRYRRVMELFGAYQAEVLAHYPEPVSCGKGCSVCCCHWVEDVYSFEAEILADHIRRHVPHRIPALVQAFEEDYRVLRMLDEQVERRIESTDPDHPYRRFDLTDVLLACFYQSGRPCALLDENGCCTVYPVRPLTCRIYVSFSHPRLCRRGSINDGRTRTYLLDLEEEASELLDRLHDRFDRFDGDTGLRSLLMRILSDDRLV